MEEPMNQPDYPTCCAELHRKVDRILELLEERQAKREPADGVYRVTIPPASRAWARAEAQQCEARRAAGHPDDNLLADVTERLRVAVKEGAAE
jgi:hypothetical protein